MPLRWLACLLPGLWQCSALFAELPPGQCATDADCQQLGMEGASCAVEHGVCVSAQPLLEPAGTAFTCRLGDGAAGAPDSPLLSRECACVAGDWQDPDALVVGTLSPHTFGEGSGAALAIPFVPRWLRSIELGLEEWQGEVAGGRLSRSQRPLALLHCNSGDDLATARRALAHLAEVARAPIVLTLTDNDTRSVRPQAQRAQLSVWCAMCFARAPADSEKASLLWHGAPPLADQAPLAAWRIAGLARELRDESADPDEVLEVVRFSQAYPGIDEYVQELGRLLDLQGGFHVTEVQTPDPRQAEVVQLDVARAVVAARPRIIAVGMDTDFTTYYLRMIEAEWPEGVPRPHYVLSHLNQELGLLGDIVRDDDELRRRLSGTGWALSPAVAANLAALEQRFERRYGERLDNTQSGYDAFYAAVYALMLADAGGGLDGPALSESLSRLSSGVATHVGPEALRAALGFVLSGEALDLVGAANELDFAPVARQTRSDVALWCLAREAGGQLALLPDAGPRWQQASGEISGAGHCP